MRRGTLSGLLAVWLSSWVPGLALGASPLSALDPAGDRQLRAAVPGAYRTQIGAQISPSCLKWVPKEFQNRPDELRAILERPFAEATNTIVQCRQKYPELDVYLKEWVTRARREVIECSPDTSSKYSAFNNLRGTTTFYRDYFQHLVVQPHWKTEPMHQVAVGVLIHEIFHGTSANNRHDHGEIELRVPDRCEENVAIDRVNLLQSLCTGLNVGTSQITALEALATRMDRCGEKYGCELSFTEGRNTYDLGHIVRASDLDSKSAARMCRRIHEQGHCQKALKASGPQLVSSLEPVRSLRERLHARLADVTPRFENQIPVALLELYPQVGDRLRSLSREGDRCFQSLFSVGKNGDLWLRKTSWCRASKGFNADGVPLSRLASALKGIAAEANTCLANARLAARGCDADDVDKILEPLQALVSAVDLDASWTLSSSVDDFESGRFSVKVPSEFFSGTAEPGLSRLLGDDLYAELASTSRRFHPLSPTFDCASAGLSPEEDARRDLEFVRKRVEGRNRSLLPGAARAN